MITALGLALALFGAPLIALVSERPRWQATPVATHLAAQAALVVLTAGVVAIAVLDEQLPPSAIGLRPPTWGGIAAGLLLTAFFRFAFAPAAYRLLAWSGLGGFEAGLGRLATLPLWTLVLAVLVGGAAEEILYRGYAIERLAAVTGSLWLGATLSVLVFALAHLPLWGRGPALTTLFSGAVFALVYLWRRDLTANIVAHVLTDLQGIVGGAIRARRA